MERWWIVYVLPLEVWMDIFCFPWITREEFGQLVESIGNFKFAEHAQFFLHEWGKHTLCNVFVDKDGSYKYVDFMPYRLEYPQMPIPENIKSFDSITIKHFDANTLDFLAKIKPLLTEIRICLGSIKITTDFLENLCTILTILAPSLDGIQALYCIDDSTLPNAKKHLFQSSEKLAKLKWFIMNVTEMEQQENANFIMNWLVQPDTNGPKLFEFRCDNNTKDLFTKQIFKAIREQFIAAKTPCTFAVNLISWKILFAEFVEFHWENGIGEELHGAWTKIEYKDVFQITRHRASWNTKEVQKWIGEVIKERDWPCIWIEQPTIGSLDAAPQMMDLQPVDEAQNDQQPSTSKEA